MSSSLDDGRTDAERAADMERAERIQAIVRKIGDAIGADHRTSEVLHALAWTAGLGLGATLDPELDDDALNDEAARLAMVIEVAARHIRAGGDPQ